ncbi:hypothetical protein OG21DRAFT_1528053, partial [Imleria badia]
MAPSTLSLLITIVLSLLQGSCAIPFSNAMCQPEYAWMDNAEQLNPCWTVTYVIAACNGDKPSQVGVSMLIHGNVVNSSWSCYNLMMDCTLCQNLAYTSNTKTWPSFSENCPSNYKDEIFLHGYVLANYASISYWATINYNLATIIRAAISSPAGILLIAVLGYIIYKHY